MRRGRSTEMLLFFQRGFQSEDWFAAVFRALPAASAVFLFVADSERSEGSTRWFCNIGNVFFFLKNELCHARLEFVPLIDKSIVFRFDDTFDENLTRFDLKT